MSLLFVEGAPGTGKSTTAQFLAVHSSRHGRPARWVYEDEAPHPIFGTQADTSSWDAYFAQSVERWRLFAARARVADEITVIESALLQRPVFTLLREDVARETTLGFLARIADVVRDADPVLVHLSHADHTAGFRALCRRRGTEWVRDHVRRLEASPFAKRRGVAGVDGLERYWSEHEALTHSAVPLLGLQTIGVQRAGDWDGELACILSALSWPPADQPPHGEAGLARYAGRYRDGRSRECTVDLDGTGLRLHGVLWPANRLVPKAGNVFYAEAWPIEVAFEESPAGAVRTLRVVENRVRSSRLHGVYEKVG